VLNSLKQEKISKMKDMARFKRATSQTLQTMARLKRAMTMLGRDGLQSVSIQNKNAGAWLRRLKIET
jgi:type II secretory pathway component PulJ